MRHLLPKSYPFWISMCHNFELETTWTQTWAFLFKFNLTQFWASDTKNSDSTWSSVGNLKTLAGLNNTWFSKKLKLNLKNQGSLRFVLHLQRRLYKCTGCNIYCNECGKLCILSVTANGHNNEKIIKGRVFLQARMIDLAGNWHAVLISYNWICLKTHRLVFRRRVFFVCFFVFFPRN